MSEQTKVTEHGLNLSLNVFLFSVESKIEAVVENLLTGVLQLRVIEPVGATKVQGAQFLVERIVDISTKKNFIAGHRAKLLSYTRKYAVYSLPMISEDAIKYRDALNACKAMCAEQGLCSLRCLILTP